VFSNALVGVDGRSGGRDAIALALRLVESDGKLTLAHVYEGRLRPSRAITPGRVDEDREASAKLLERERTAAGSTELVSIEATSPGRGLHEQAENQGADLLVVGSFSRGMIGRVMLGDDARAALNGAPCAVAVAAHGYGELTDQLRRIGVGYDSSPESKAALEAARRLTADVGAALQALEVVPIDAYISTGFAAATLAEDLDAMVEDAEKRLKQELPDVEARAVCGLTGEELAAFGDRLDLLVVGSRGYGPMKRLVLGSTSNYLERHARCSLLVLPRAAGDAKG
jgi:nucleotide-binding universal stress UspA family protein